MKKSLKCFIALVTAASLVSVSNAAGAASYDEGGGSATGKDALAIGVGATASKDYATAIGYNSKAEGENSMALGYYAQAKEWAAASGYYAKALGEYSVAFGRYVTANGSEAMAFGGYGTEANGQYSFAGGREAIANGKYSTALCNNVTAGSISDDEGNTAIGYDVTTSGRYSTGVGHSITVAGRESSAFGRNLEATGNLSLAVGHSSTASNEQSIAIGYSAESTGSGALAVGVSARAESTQSAAYGYYSQVGETAAHSVAIGYRAKVNDGASNSSAFGNEVTVDRASSNSLAIGYKAKVSLGLTNAVAIGSNATASESNTVSIGNSTTQSRLVNLMAGTKATDAVNVSQLNELNTLLGGSTISNGQWGEKFTVDGTEYNSVADAISSLAGGGSENAVEYDADDKSSVTLGGTNGTKITNVADGSADSDAVNFKQLSAVSEEAKNKGTWTLQAKGDGWASNRDIGDGDGITIAEGSNLKITAASGTYTFGVVDNPEFASVKIGDYTISHNNGLDMGGAVLDNVAAGSIASGSMQAVNGGQLFTTNTNLSNLGGSVASAFGGAWNYENGALSGEFTYNGSGTTLQGALDSISAKLDELSEGWYFEANDGGASGEAGTGAGESQIKPGDKLTVNAGEDINITQNGDKDYTISVDPNLKEEIKDGYTTADNILKEGITDDYTTADNILKEQIKNDYTTADNILKEQIKNDYTTADNVLKEEITDAYTNADNVMKEEITDAYTTADNVLKEQIKDDYTTADNVLKEQIKNDYTTADNIVREEFKAADSELRADIDKSAATIEEIGGVLGGAENGYMTPTFNSVTANSLTMGNYTMSATNSGFDMGGARLSGIADGGIYRGSSDAVTGNQLWEAYNRMDDLGERINVVGAHAAALSGLHPIDYNPYEPTTLSAAVGTYRDEYAVAVGVFHYTRENVMFNLGASLCSDGDIMGRAGVSFTLGKSSKKQPLPPKDMNEVQAQLAQVQQALFELKAENKELREKLEAQR